MKDFLSRVIASYGHKVSTSRDPLIGVPNIRGHINLWQFLGVLLSALLTGVIAAGHHIIGMQSQLTDSLGGVLAGALVAAITGGLALLSGKPVEDIAEDIIGKAEDAPRSDSEGDK